MTRRRPAPAAEPCSMETRCRFASIWTPTDLSDASRRCWRPSARFRADVDAAVAAIIEDVRSARRRGARRLFAPVRSRRSGATGPRGDRRGEIDAALRACEPSALEALELAHERVLGLSQRQKPADCRSPTSSASNWAGAGAPIDAVGLYVPGGAASYPSSVVMNAVPAKVAGLRRASRWRSDAGRASQSAGAGRRAARRRFDEIYRVGGAQAIAALAYGTQTIRPVAKIVGPGNAYVAAAKRRVFGVVGIDMIAGPSEVVVLADSSADPRFVAADLLAQAEHDEAAQSILITDDARLAREVAAAVERQLAALPRKRIAARELARLRRDHPLAPSARGRAPLVDRLAPEHLEIIARDADALRRQHQQRRRDLPRRASRPRRSATMSAAPTTSCRPRARRGSPPASACSIS